MDEKKFKKQYNSKEWFEVSKRIKSRDHNTCQMCGCNDKPLSVHHLYYGDDGDILDVPDNALITLCEDCHSLQKDYRDECYEILSNFRFFYTDFEIYKLLIKLYYDYCYIGAPFSSPTPISDNIDELDVDAEERRKLLNLACWRKGVVLGDMMKDMLTFFLYDKAEGRNNKGVYDEWFIKHSGKPLDSYHIKYKKDNPDEYQKMVETAEEVAMRKTPF